MLHWASEMSWGIPTSQKRIGLHLVLQGNALAGSTPPQHALEEHPWGLEPEPSLRISCVSHLTLAISICATFSSLLLVQPVIQVMKIHLISKYRLVISAGKMCIQIISRFMVGANMTQFVGNNALASERLTLFTSLTLLCSPVFNYWVDNHPGGADKIQAFGDVDKSVFLTFPGWHDMPR